eukprot:7201322-Prymnesium_polylepis.1
MSPAQNTWGGRAGRGSVIDKNCLQPSSEAGGCRATRGGRRGLKGEGSGREVRRARERGRLDG